MKNISHIKAFLKEHLLVTIIASACLLIAIILIIIMSISNAPDDGIEGTSSKEYEASISADKKALESNETFKIYSYLPIVSKDPAYKISYSLTRDDAGDYHFSLVLSAFSASARESMVKRLLSENFGSHDPLTYDIIIENYYNPFSNTSAEDLENNNLPEQVSLGALYKLGDSTYSVRTLIHTIYDGSINTYRYVLKDGEPVTAPQLFFTYADLPFLSHEEVKSINNLSATN